MGFNIGSSLTDFVKFLQIMPKRIQNLQSKKNKKGQLKLNNEKT